MTGQPLGERHFGQVTPFRSGRSAEPSAIERAAEASRAASLVPPAVLQGCREAIQRISEPDPHSLGVTSTLRGEGRSTVAAGLALVEWLDYERRTVLVDLDLEHPSLHERFGVKSGPGIAGLIDGHNAVEDHLQQIAGDLWLLSAGQLLEDAPRTLSKLAHSAVISQLAEWADAVVFDLPPLLGSPTGLEAARLCRTPVLVVRAGVTPLPSVKRATDALSVAPPIILNDVHSALPRWIRRVGGDGAP
jgi:Mrp family chromosome partitioning ATPase